MSQFFKSTRGFRPRRLAVVAVVPLTVLAVGLSSGGPSVASSPSEQSNAKALPAGSYVPGQLLVRFAAGTTPAAAAAVNAKIGSTTEKSFSDLVPNLQLVRLSPSTSVSSALVSYAQQADVMYAQPNWVSHIEEAKTQSITKIPNDPQYPQQWDWPKIDAPAAWGKTTGSPKIVVMDVDTGMDYNHEDLKANAWQNTAECKGKKDKDDDKNGYVDDCHGIDTFNGDSDPMDDNSHGTHTAGTIGAVGDNKIGVTGLNWDVQVMPCKSHDSGGSGTVASIIECFGYAKMEKVEFGYDIVSTNNSYGSCPEACDFSPATYDAIAALIKPGVIMSFSAGNAARDNDVRGQYPANYDLPNIISVAATDANDGLAGFSQYGLRSVDVGAPGVSVLSTFPDDTYGSISGTSMASPHVAGLAALLHAYDSKLSWSSIRNLIVAGGDKVASVQGKTVSGRRINAAGSMNCSGQKVVGLLSPVANTGTMKQTVSALNINCAKPAGDIKVTITPGKTTLALKDDGKGADLVAKDGIYAASWTPSCGAGDFKFALSTGQKYPVSVSACIKLDSKSGAPGSKVKVTGSGYTANEIVDVFFDQKLVDTVNADGKGKVSDTITVPKSTDKGNHLVTVSGQTSGLASTAGFKVT
jgi:subtilisin family serine protease